MTILEIILISILWLSYGIFSGFQSINRSSLGNKNMWQDAPVTACFFVMMVPITLIYRALYGIFRKYDLNVN